MSLRDLREAVSHLHMGRAPSEVSCYTDATFMAEHTVSTQPTYRALVVEDDPAIRRLVEKLLTRLHIDIDTAPDGRIAIDKLRSGHYSVIVLDLMVPEVDGFELIDFLKQHNVRTPVAVVSAVSQQALTRLDLDIVKLVISKPFDVDEFTKAILALCAEGEA
jgi:two-component system, OmpR family, alkaline phosphatase synthesis response regulator PhoP